MEKKPKIGQTGTDPLRDELFSEDHLAHHAKETARSHTTDPKKRYDLLLLRLADNEKTLLEVHDLLYTAIEAKRRITPAGEWLLDNFYFIEQQIRTARCHLPEGYSKELPHLVRGPLKGYPRIYHVARELILHSDGRIDTESLFDFIDAYQSVTPLLLGELWAIPIMLRLSLIENLRRISEIIAANMRDRISATYWVEQMTKDGGENPNSLVQVIADMERSNPPMTSAFVAEMARHLQGRPGAPLFPFTRIEHILSERNLTVEQLVNAEAQAQAANQVSFRNSITSLRLVDKTEWREFVEKLSLVEHALRSDPADEYAAMDFATRDHYRHVVEEIAKKGGFSEDAVAGKAVELARESRDRKDKTIRASHVGYYLIAEGRGSLEKALSFRPPFIDRIKRTAHAHSPVLYFSGILFITFIVIFFGYTRLADYEWLVVLPFLVLLLFPASQAAIAVINWFVTLLLTPALLPKMDYSKGIPAERKTIVVVPTILSGIKDVQGLLDSLEIRYLANRSDNLCFALLTDLKNADTQELPEDAETVSLLAAGIEHLNRKYHDVTPDTFFLMHRSRTWSENEGVWMGHERKRGALMAFSAFLLDKEKNPFSRIVGNQEMLTGITYVITLDTDTHLPRNSARKLIGAMAHPLNQPVLDPATRVIREGYGILQPRVVTFLSKSGISRFVSLFGGEQGIDPYTRAVSDVYQDAFHEGSFVGKGIYDLDAFSQTVVGRFPENLILSHDLLEGCYARTGLVSDVQFFEEYPTSYLADCRRRHRWIRGDWQLLPWLFPFVRSNAEKKERNPLSLVSRWKIFDNLRRSLIAPMTFFFLILAWICLASPLFWTAFIVSLYLIPPLTIIGWKCIKKPKEQTWALHLYNMPQIIRGQLAGALVSLAFLPHEAYVSLDAVFRSCWRMAISHCNLLEWTTHQEVRRAEDSGISGTYRIMWSGPVTGAVLFFGMGFIFPFARPASALFALVWIVSPAIAWWISQPIKTRTTSITPEQAHFLRGIARRTWHFFETFVTVEDHYLPPDNYQEQPVRAVAHRTSPTNIGLSLLANLTAYDFGYIPMSELIERTQNTMTTMGQMERFRGHFYNWYDTITLEPQFPGYISTVDSGNLVGSLLVLKQGLYELPGDQVLSHTCADGLSDTLSLFSEAIAAATKKNKEVVPPSLKLKIADLKDGAARMPEATIDALNHLRYLDGVASEVLSELNACQDGEVRWWAAATKRQVETHLQDLKSFTTWESTGSPPDTLLDEFPQDLTPYLSLVCRKVETLNSQIPSVRDVAAISEDLSIRIGPLMDWLDTHGNANRVPGSGHHWLVRTLEEMTRSSERAEERIRSILLLADQCSAFSEIEYEFLYDRASNLLSIGYNATDFQLDVSFYDLLASEARLTSFIGIAQNKLPLEHWFALGRLLTTIGKGTPILISWSGSMFEYLMPLLVMPTYENTLLDHTYHAVVAKQIEYGRKKGIPWGISESGYNITDTNLNYQYRAFGIPGLGFKLGLARDLVVAPYAAVMGLMVNPALAAKNLEHMESLGYAGAYGFYEAIDFTPSRVPPGQKHTIVRSFMAHHQGMILLSLAYELLHRPMQKRFEADPSLQATMMLLQEKMPMNTPFHPHTWEVLGTHKITEEEESPMRTFQTANTPRPEVQLLSNGRYHVMINNSGSGYSRWDDLAMTRWREDPTADNNGTFCYIRDIASGEFWSNGYQPTRKSPDLYHTIFQQSRAEYFRRDQDFDTHTDITVSPEDDVELRRIRVTNRTWTRRTIEFTSYAEVVLAPQSSDETHPAFSNLFVQTELVRDKSAILATRRPRSDGERPPWMFHLMTVHGTQARKKSFETDRSKFIGRGNSLSRPIAMIDSSTLSDTAGSVLNPIVAIRCTIVLEPHETAGVTIFTGVSESRERSTALIEKYFEEYTEERVFELAWTHSQVMLAQLNTTERDAQLFCSLASPIIYANPCRRAAQNIILKNNRGQSDLWGYGISGDIPIVLVRIKNRNRVHLVAEMVQAHAYWRMKGLIVDLIIWNEGQSGYRQELQDEIMRQIPPGSDPLILNQKGGIIIRRIEHISEEDRILFQTVARAIISDRGGTLSEQLKRARWSGVVVPKLYPTQTPHPEPKAGPDATGKDLLYFNGTGGFSQDGREYVIITGKWKITPAPWVNVIANENFGTVISESGSAYTWGENAHEFRLTPWTNDPIQDLSGEALYIRDEETGVFWSPTALPVRGENQYVTRHGFGYSVFEHCEHGICTELTVYVSIDNPVKFMSLRIRNISGRRRHLSVTGYVEWVLNELRSKSLLHVITEIDQTSGAIFAENPYNSEFPGRVAFFDANMLKRTVTGDRHEFIGRNGSLEKPAAMKQVSLSNKVGAALDPCAAMQVQCELTDGEEREIIFTLGVGRNRDEARMLALKNRGVWPARTALAEVKEYWDQTLGAVAITTPDQSVDLLVNGWLLYQTIASRLWARSGFYQSGGAFGYRDQLQDVMALIHTRPELMRKQLILHAEHQFVEGDVQHWWHPPSNRGVRTHCSDDYLWLPFATCRYVLATWDTGVLDEEISFLEGRKLPPEEDSYYDLPHQSDTSGTLYEHCIRAIRWGLKFGRHGLPLMGTGDWNDGMNLVGAKGKGESVWLGFFLFDVLMQFHEVAELHGDPSFAKFCRVNAERLQEDLERHGWDGEWYRRAYFDSGQPLGSSENSECMIDSIAQSWAVLSGAASDERAITAMEAVNEHLILADDQLIILFTPPFDVAHPNPGYIKGYVPGVRENAGQYSHAAIWVVMAFATLKECQKAWDLLPSLSPIHHSKTPEDVREYQVEPYVVASDIYAAPPHTGRGGWTWYSGASGWTYTLILESLLGLHLSGGDTIRFEPCIPTMWNTYQIDYRYRSTTYHIVVHNSGLGSHVRSVVVDGIDQEDKNIHLVNDQGEHQVVVELGACGEICVKKNDMTK